MNEQASASPGGRERQRERESVLLCSPGVILAWIWDGLHAF